MIVFGLVIVLCCLYGFAYLLGNDLVSVSDQCVLCVYDKHVDYKYQIFHIET